MSHQSNRDVSTQHGMIADVNATAHMHRQQVLREWAQDMLDVGLVLDTETTGLDQTAEILEIAVVEADEGQVLLDTLVRPSTEALVRGWSAAEAIHGIGPDDVRHAPTWPQVWRWLEPRLRGAKLAIYNAPYDCRLIDQSCRAWGIPEPALLAQSRCVMAMAAAYFGAGPHARGQRWFRLTELETPQPAHRAAGDAVATHRLLDRILEDLGP